MNENLLLKKQIEQQQVISIPLQLNSESKSKLKSTINKLEEGLIDLKNQYSEIEENEM